MATTNTNPNDGNPTLEERIAELLQREYREDVGTLADRFPKEQRSIAVSFEDILRFDPDMADDVLEEPDAMQPYFDQALTLVDLPVDLDLEGATVRITDLPTEERFYPGHFSPTYRHKHKPYVTIEGQVEKATDVNPKLDVAELECPRCGEFSTVPQSGREYREPYQCPHCERNTSFQVDRDRSEFRDFQLIRVAEPPEVVAAGDGATIDVSLSDELADRVRPGDRVNATGILRLSQKTSGQQKSPEFVPYLEGRDVEVCETDFEDIDVTPEDEATIRAMAAGEHGPLFAVVTGSIAPDLLGEKYDLIKEAMFLLLVGGATGELPTGRKVRGIFHMLLIGDASTGKSTLLREADLIAPKSVYASGKGATEAGMTASAVQDDFGDSAWTLEAGALVQANNGIACIDEIDKVREDVQDSMHGAMADMVVDINKAGINTTLPAETTVLAGGNPAHSRWDEYEADVEQISVSETLLSRFALVYKLRDIPDEETDRERADHILETKEAAKRGDLGDGDDERVIGHELLRKYIAYARQLPDPQFRSEAEQDELREDYVRMRGIYGHDTDAPVPITPRKLQDLHRIAEASARARLSETIESEDIQRAKRLVAEHLNDFGQNEEGDFDADLVETKSSKPQRDRKRAVEETVRQLADDPDHGDVDGCPQDAVIDALSGEYPEHLIREDMRKMCDKEGVAYQPTTGETIKWLGRGG